MEVPGRPRRTAEAVTNAEERRTGDALLDPPLIAEGLGDQSLAHAPDGDRLDHDHAAAAPVRSRQSGVKAVLSRLPMFDLGGPHVPVAVQPLITTLKRDWPKVDVKTVLRAYQVAEAAHAGQQRQSGEPYIIHPIGVTEVLAELGMDTQTICASLLHDTVEDTDITLADIARDFGEECASLVDGVTKLDKLQVPSKEERQAESIRKMFIAMATDFRVLVIKLADRLHNMRTIHHMPRQSQKRIAEETLWIYAPLAHRLGMQNFRCDLEDLSFQTLFPKRYDEIAAMVAERQPERDRYLRQLEEEVKERLRAEKIRGEVKGRPKHYWSIYEKMRMSGKEFAEIYDIVGIRVIVDRVKDCYAALGIIHKWRPIPGRFKDYIAMPKFNLYQSLHTSVVGPDGKPLEAQIRTRAMHYVAEFGIAAHWKYKGSAGVEELDPKGASTESQWLKRMMTMQGDTKDPAEFVRNMRAEFDADEVFVFTPNGDIKGLPSGSTPVDFAYAIHTDIGHRTIGARVSGRLVSLDYELRNGEMVEILTSKAPEAGPSRDWLGFVGSSRAQSKIKQWFSRERRVDAIEKGREELKRELAERGQRFKRLLGAPELREIAESLRCQDLEVLYREVGDGHITAAVIVAQLVERVGNAATELEAPKRDREPDIRPSDAVVVENTDNIWVTLARCCSPVPSDSIIGFVTTARGVPSAGREMSPAERGVSVHREDCPNAQDLRRDVERVVPVRWDTRAPVTFRVNLQVEALDRKQLLRDICAILGDLQVNIISAQVTTQRSRVAYLRFAFELADITHLDHILGQVRRVESVFDAYRIVPRPGKGI